MEDVIVEYYQDGLYTLNDLQTFVDVGELSQETFNDLKQANSQNDATPAN